MPCVVVCRGMPIVVYRLLCVVCWLVFVDRWLLVVVCSVLFVVVVVRWLLFFCSFVVLCV